jgi:hypothetical protein
MHLYSSLSKENEFVNIRGQLLMNNGLTHELTKLVAI